MKRFKELKDGWIKDSLTGLDWGQSSDKTMTFKQALAYCKKLGARLPTSQELMSLIDHSKRCPASELDMKTDDWYWTGTSVAGYPVDAWCVIFGYGSVGGNDKDDDYYVRPVRASQ